MPDNKDKRFNTTQKMLEWQYYQILGDLQEIQRHDGDETCPCRLSEDLGENCLAKHSLGLSIIAAETAAMETNEDNSKLLWTLAGEAKEHHQQIKGFLCHKEDPPEFGDWSRQWRKKFEPIYSLIGDEIQDKYTVIVDPNPEILDGKIYIVQLGTEYVARHLHRENGFVILTSSNGKYEKLQVKEVEIKGRVVLSGNWKKH